MFFTDRFCDRCWYDREEACPILAEAYRTGGHKYWISEDDGTNALCTKYTATAPKEFPEDEKLQLRLF
jgi:hypothetical protein